MLGTKFMKSDSNNTESFFKAHRTHISKEMISSLQRLDLVYRKITVPSQRHCISHVAYRILLNLIGVNLFNLRMVQPSNVSIQGRRFECNLAHEGR
jgi:hypothetical protein